MVGTGFLAAGRRVSSRDAQSDIASVFAECWVQKRFRGLETVLPWPLFYVARNVEIEHATVYTADPRALPPAEIVHITEAVERWLGHIRPLKVVGMLWVQGVRRDVEGDAVNLRRLVLRSRATFKNPRMIFPSGRIPAKSDRQNPFWHTVLAKPNRILKSQVTSGWTATTYRPAPTAFTTTPHAW